MSYMNQQYIRLGEVSNYIEADMKTAYVGLASLTSAGKVTKYLHIVTTMTYRTSFCVSFAAPFYLLERKKINILLRRSM